MHDSASFNSRSGLPSSVISKYQLHVPRLGFGIKYNNYGIIDSVDSVSRDGLDTTIHAIHYKKPKKLRPVNFFSLLNYIFMILS